MDIVKHVLKATGSSKISDSAHIQSLWSDYGEIRRYQLKGGVVPSVIVKHIRLPDHNQHPKRWNSDFSHQRKVQSYEVEQYWYAHYASYTTDACRTPQHFASLSTTNEQLLIIEDLDAVGFPIRKHTGDVQLADVKSCLSWLAYFHAQFMDVEPQGLWPVGTYWHLATRPDEYEAMQHQPLKQAAQAIDAKLKSATHQTIVHGDAKLANFCFGRHGQVAAVDFQYVGKGCGMKDVAYLISSCFDDEADCEQYEQELLDHYFTTLSRALPRAYPVGQLQEEWIALYKYAWADFYRFLDGWSPGHWKMHAYSERLMQEVIRELEYAE